MGRRWAKTKRDCRQDRRTSGQDSAIKKKKKKEKKKKRKEKKRHKPRDFVTIRSRDLPTVYRTNENYPSDGWTSDSPASAVLEVAAATKFGPKPRDFGAPRLGRCLISGFR